jgi:hypothetical protein
MTGTRGKGMKVRVGHRGQELNARLVASSTGWDLRIVERANDPAAVAAFQSVGPPAAGSEVNVEFVGERFAELGAKISWLRSGFLALFAALGYRFSFDPALRIVKKQVRSPASRRIYSFTIEIPARTPWSNWRMLAIPDPQCTGVMFGRYVIVFPNRGDLTFYERLAMHIRSSEGKKPVVATAQSFALTDREPLFGYDLVDLNSPGRHGQPSPLSR